MQDRLDQIRTSVLKFEQSSFHQQQVVSGASRADEDPSVVSGVGVGYGVTRPNALPNATMCS